MIPDQISIKDSPISVSTSDDKVVIGIGEAGTVVSVSKPELVIAISEEKKVVVVSEQESIIAFGGSGVGTGTSSSEKYTFTNADLTGTQLIRTHGLADTVIQSTITDSNGKTVQVAWIDSSLTTQVTVELKGTTIANVADGTWSIRLSA